MFKSSFGIVIFYSHYYCGTNYIYYFQAPAFVFVDEIDAIAGRHARKDPRRRATFEALIAQLDGE